jgi:hypothetical protein
MRPALFVMVLVARVAHAAEPSCQPDGLLVFPAPGSVVPTNVSFVLEGVGEEQTRVADLVGSDGVQLVPNRKDGGAVPVKVEKGWVSQMKRVAVKLKPTRALAPETDYTLIFGRSLGRVVVINDALGDNGLQWTTAGGPDREQPKYRSKPAVSEGRYVKDEKGEALIRQLTIRSEVEETGPAYYLISMQRSRGSSVRQQYPVPLTGNSTVIGHDACSGTFGLEDGRAYKLQLELFDSAGNRNAEKVNLEISAPRPSR